MRGKVCRARKPLLLGSNERERSVAETLLEQRVQMSAIAVAAAEVGIRLVTIAAAARAAGMAAARLRQ